MKWYGNSSYVCVKGMTVEGSAGLGVNTRGDFHNVGSGHGVGL